ncbi:hypothetical protein [Thermoanaerobacter mathranii]|uniref:hypothetical protein n=1 Tax=Thermoanaerobacter mathranii TaxID=583357 RepID=UPI0005A07BD2|nr:hypothetical protein [Thermoanaerobacter mathranii]
MAILLTYKVKYDYRLVKDKLFNIIEEIKNSNKTIVYILMEPHREYWKKGLVEKLLMLLSLLCIIVIEIAIFFMSKNKFLMILVLLFTNTMIFLVLSILLRIFFKVINFFVSKLMLIPMHLGDMIIAILFYIIFPNVLLLYIRTEILIQNKLTPSIGLLSICVGYFIFVKLLIGFIKQPPKYGESNKLGWLELLMICLFIFLVLTYLFIIDLSWVKFSNEMKGIFGIENPEQQWFRLFVITIILIFSIGGFDSISSIYESLVIIVVLPLSAFFWTVFVSKLISYSDEEDKPKSVE